MRVLLSSEAQAQVDSLPFKIQERVTGIVDRLKFWPNVSGAKFLVREWAGHARIRTGDYRVVFRVPSPSEDVMTIVAVDDRKDVYGGKRSARSPLRRIRGGVVDALPYVVMSMARNAAQARLDAGLTQMEVAAKIGVSQTMVAGVERGRIRIGQRYISALLKACGQPSDYPVHRRVHGKRAASPRHRSSQ
jgi:mRNA-degrading endonuclease RelE of RelBE toxin-antitoxin system